MGSEYMDSAQRAEREIEFCEDYQDRYNEIYNQSSKFFEPLMNALNKKDLKKAKELYKQWYPLEFKLYNLASETEEKLRSMKPYEDKDQMLYIELSIYLEKSNLAEMDECIEEQIGEIEMNESKPKNKNITTKIEIENIEDIFKKNIFFKEN